MFFHKRRNTHLHRKKLQYSSDSSSLPIFRVYIASVVLVHREKTDNEIHFKIYIHVVFEKAPDKRQRCSLQK